jgi:chloride channel protein, CIC family
MSPMLPGVSAPPSPIDDVLNHPVLGLSAAGIDQPPADDSGYRGLVRLCVIAVVGGALTGLVGGLFRAALTQADRFRMVVVDWAREEPAWRWMVPVVLAGVGVALARLIVRWVPTAAGSGVQRVEAAMRAEVEPAVIKVVPAKFVGGVLAIGSGLALGREGPSVQMGAAIGVRLARLGKTSAHNVRTIAAALAGAGLGVAFSAPMGGAAFVFEEVARAFRTQLVVVTLLGCGSALAVAQLIVGSQPVFDVQPPPADQLWQLPLVAILGALLGALGVAYNWLVVRLLDLFEAIKGVPAELKAGVVGGLVGLLGVIAPGLIGGGGSLNEEVILGGTATATLLGWVIVRWFLGPISYSLGTPGGLFAPLLLLGAGIGALFAEVLNALAPGLELSPTAMAIVGMSTFFASVVRAPITGVLLIVEMTATTSQVVPMVIAASMAVLVATLLKGPPIYDSLRARLQGPQPVRD